MNPLETRVDIDQLLRSAIRRYYEQTFVTVPDLPKREFGYSMERGRKIQTRHVSFKSPKEFNAFLRREAPFYVSYSVALYRTPSAKDFEEAGFLGADWVFEFDMEYITKDDVIYCPKCDKVYHGEELMFSDPSRCPSCGADTVIVRVPDPRRFFVAKRYTNRLIKLLREDFGVKDDEIKVNFSGNRGFHIHVISEEWEGIPPENRDELASYLTADVDPTMIVAEDDAGVFLYSFGIHGRIARHLMSRFPYSVVGDRVYFSIDRNTAIKAVEEALSKVALPIDVHTTTDIHRLIRVPNSIHGSTGLIAKTIEDLEEFNPYKDAVLPIRHTVTARVRYLPEIEWAGEKYGPYENETVELPVTLVLYLTAGVEGRKE